MSTRNDLIEILDTICGRDIETPKGLNLDFLFGIIPTELFLSIPSHSKQNALYGKNELLAYCLLTKPSY